MSVITFGQRFAVTRGYGHVVPLVLRFFIPISRKNPPKSHLIENIRHISDNPLSPFFGTVRSGEVNVFNQIK